MLVEIFAWGYIDRYISFYFSRLLPIGKLLIYTNYLATNILTNPCMPRRLLRKIILMIKSAKDVVGMPLKSSYKSNSTRHLYEIADEIAPTAAAAEKCTEAANRGNNQ